MAAAAGEAALDHAEDPTASTTTSTTMAALTKGDRRRKFVSNLSEDQLSVSSVGSLDGLPTVAADVHGIIGQLSIMGVDDEDDDANEGGEEENHERSSDVTPPTKTTSEAVAAGAEGDASFFFVVVCLFFVVVLVVVVCLLFFFLAAAAAALVASSAPGAPRHVECGGVHDAAADVAARRDGDVPRAGAARHRRHARAARHGDGAPRRRPQRPTREQGGDGRWWPRRERPRGAGVRLGRGPLGRRLRLRRAAPSEPLPRVGPTDATNNSSGSRGAEDKQQ